MNIPLIQKYLGAIQIDTLPEGLLRALERSALKWRETDERALTDEKEQLEAELQVKQIRLQEISDTLSAKFIKTPSHDGLTA